MRVDMNDYKIYLDLDGVLVNFQKGIQEHTNDPDITFGGVQEAFKTMHGNYDFWANLEPLKGWDDIWKTVKRYECFVLSSCSNLGEKCKCGKIDWVKRHLNGMKEDNIIIVQDMHEKAFYANEKSILIDDMEKNIIQWVEAGGIGILYRNIEQTINEFKRYEK